jgi:uncharacterized membrane protein
MSYLIVVTFDNTEEAGKVRAALKSQEKGGRLKLDDSAVIVKDEDGKVHVKDQMDRGVKVGAVGGGAIGLLLAGIFFPIAGIVIGAVAGGLIGGTADLGIEKKFIKQVRDGLQPGTSAIFFIVREANPTAVVAALKPFKGEVYQSSLPTEADEHLRDVLSKRIED